MPIMGPARSMWYVVQCLAALGAAWLFIYLGQEHVIEPVPGRVLGLFAFLAALGVTVGLNLLRALALGLLVWRRVRREARRGAALGALMDPKFRDLEQAESGRGFAPRLMPPYCQPFDSREGGGRGRP